MAVKRDKPEQLAPAGDLERLKMAVLYGADAVYLAGTSYGMRAFAGNFSDEELPQAVAFAHSHGVRVHCTINTMPRNDEAARLPEHLEPVNILAVGYADGAPASPERWRTERIPLDELVLARA